MQGGSSQQHLVGSDGESRDREFHLGTIGMQVVRGIQNAKSYAGDAQRFGRTRVRIVYQEICGPAILCCCEHQYGIPAG